MSRPLVIGVGNPYRRDDGVGPAVVAALAAGEVAGAGGAVEVIELDGEATRLVESWAARPLAVVVDALRTGEAPGSVHRLVVGDDQLPGWGAGASSHAAGLAEAVALGAALDRLPARLGVIGIAPADVGDGPGLAEPVAAAVARAVDLIEAELAEVHPCA